MALPVLNLQKAREMDVPVMTACAPCYARLRTANHKVLNDADHIKKIAKSITLEAVIAGTNPEAFIDDKLVSVGHKLAVRYNGRIYEFIVTGIHENKVVLKWNDFTVDVKMSQLDEKN